MPALSVVVVNEFCQLCNWAHDVWRTHRVLFDDNPLKKEMEKSPAGKGLNRLSIVSQEYMLHQISKLHDPALQQGQANLGIDYVLRFGGWDAATAAKLQALKARLDGLAQKLRPARHKILSHNDLETILSSSVLGAFPAGEDIDYFKALQEFVDIVHDAVLGGPSPFNHDAGEDAIALLSCFKESV